MNTNQIQLYEEPLAAAYTIILAPEMVRYFKFTDFLKEEIDICIEMLRKSCPQPIIRPPTGYIFSHGLDIEAVDALCPDENWDIKLRIHHELGRHYFAEDVPTYAYQSFHVGLMLKEYNFQEFTKSWVKETLGNTNITLQQTLARSPEHIVLARAEAQLGYIFQKTPFVLARLAILPEETRKSGEEARKRDEEAKCKARELAELLEQEKIRRAQEVEKEARQQAKLMEQENARRTAEEKERRIRLLERKPSESSYTITLAPGIVRYLGLSVFLQADIRRWIEILRRLSPHPKIQSPSNLKEIEEFFPALTWEDRLRIHHALGRLCLDQGMPSCVYRSFHSRLNLKKFDPDACVEAWVAEAWNDYDVTESFFESPIHLICSTTDERSRCVFRKTAFVVAQLTLLAKAAQSQREKEEVQQAAEDLERLRKSHFQTFIYVMEDLRNGHFKIGQSKTPGKRERTLQAEVPQIVLRLSIPSDDEHERQLHDHFSNKRVRGEWFSLSPDDLLWLISFLKRNGDFARASVDYQMLGTIFLHSPNDVTVE